jgi:hypothetical protein
MATTAITLNVDSTILPTAIAALNWASGYTGTDASGNTITPAQGAKAAIIAHVYNCIANYQAMQAQQAVQAPSNTLIS